MGELRALRRWDRRVREAMDAYWLGVGALDPAVLSYAIDQSVKGLPEWPGGRQAFRIVRPQTETVVIASDGLSDPFSGKGPAGGAGFGMEVFIETPDLVGAEADAIRASWAFHLIENFAMNVADWGGIAGFLRETGVVSTEMPCDERVPEGWRTQSGQVGLLVNMETEGRARQAETPYGPVLAVAVTMLRPAELAFVAEGESDRPHKLAAALQALGSGHLSSLARPSLVS